MKEGGKSELVEKHKLEITEIKKGDKKPVAIFDELHIKAKTFSEDDKNPKGKEKENVMMLYFNAMGEALKGMKDEFKPSISETKVKIKASRLDLVSKIEIMENYRDSQRLPASPLITKDGLQALKKSLNSEKEEDKAAASQELDAIASRLGSPEVEGIEDKKREPMTMSSGIPPFSQRNELGDYILGMPKEEKKKVFIAVSPNIPAGEIAISDVFPEEVEDLSSQEQIVEIQKGITIKEIKPEDVTEVLIKPEEEVKVEEIEEIKPEDVTEALIKPEEEVKVEEIEEIKTFYATAEDKTQKLKIKASSRAVTVSQAQIEKSPALYKPEGSSDPDSATSAEDHDIKALEKEHKIFLTGRDLIIYNLLKSAKMDGAAIAGILQDKTSQAYKGAAKLADRVLIASGFDPQKEIKKTYFGFGGEPKDAEDKIQAHIKKVGDDGLTGPLKSVTKYLIVQASNLKGSNNLTTDKQTELIGKWNEEGIPVKNLKTALEAEAPSFLARAYEKVSNFVDQTLSYQNLAILYVVASLLFPPLMPVIIATAIFRVGIDLGNGIGKAVAFGYNNIGKVWYGCCCALGGLAKLALAPIEICCQVYNFIFKTNISIYGTIDNIVDVVSGAAARRDLIATGEKALEGVKFEGAGPGKEGLDIEKAKSVAPGKDKDALGAVAEEKKQIKSTVLNPAVPAAPATPAATAAPAADAKPQLSFDKELKEAVAKGIESLKRVDKLGSEKVKPEASPSRPQDPGIGRS